MDLGFLKNYKDNGKGVTFEFEQNKLIVSVITDEIINVFVPYMSQEIIQRQLREIRLLLQIIQLRRASSRLL